MEPQIKVLMFYLVVSILQFFLHLPVNLFEIKLTNEVLAQMQRIIFFKFYQIKLIEK